MYSVDRKNILNKIRKVRLSKEVSQSEIAKQLNISTPTYSRFERGLTKTNLSLLSDVCSILELDNDLTHNPFDFLNVVTETLELDKKDIYSQLKELVDLLEKQQALNAMILEKIKSLIKSR